MRFSSQPFNILIAEDEREIFELMEDCLTDFPGKIFWAKNGQEAIDLCRTEPIGGIICDLKMDIVDGNKFIEVLRRVKGDEIPIIVVSGFLTKEILQNFKSKKIDGVLPKPFAWDDFKDEVLGMFI